MKGCMSAGPPAFAGLNRGVTPLASAGCCWGGSHRWEWRPLWIAGAAALIAVAPDSLRAGGPSKGLLPDIRTVVPQHLNVMNEHQREILRFSNGIANTGDGPWRMRPLFPVSGAGTQDAVQEILDASGNLVQEKVVSQYEFHEQHNHWHIGNIALFEVRAGSPTGPVVGGNSIKVTFCLIDWYKLDDNSKTPERTYFDCSGTYQGISVGWVDQYHQATEGQQLDITALPAGTYYLMSTANPDGTFLEKSTTNNTAWVSFQLSRPSNGNAKIEVTGHSSCDTPGMCGEQSPNR